MAEIFTRVLEMSMMASIIIGLVLLCRLLLRRAPRIYSYILWFAVLFRLICPVALESPVSVMPENVVSVDLVHGWSRSVSEDTDLSDTGRYVTL